MSEDARDLIRHLLVRDPHLRYSAAEVLRHPWVAKESRHVFLATPRVLSRYVLQHRKKKKKKLEMLGSIVLRLASPRKILGEKFFEHSG